jgi:thiamine biosynthesis lipoprotein
MVAATHGLEYELFRAMNSEILLAAEGPHVKEGFEMARSYIESCEQRFTRFSQTSELVRLNQAAGEWVKVSPDMFDLIETALASYHTTDGLFDPSILPDLEQAGYIKSMDDLRLSGAGPQPEPLVRAGRAAFDSIELRKSDLSVRLPRGMRIDLGGIAKGWIAEKAAQRLKNYSPACAVSAGGDMFLIGTPSGLENWEIGMEDPRQPGLDLMSLNVENGAVATSSVVKRVWQQGEKARHHLIDPRTGEPAVTPWWSVTVLAPSAADAEVFAKVILIGGPGYAAQMLEKNPEITYLAVDGQGQVWIPENGQCVRLIIEN